MSELICLFGKWYGTKFFEYKTYCTTNNALIASKNKDFK